MDVKITRQQEKVQQISMGEAYNSTLYEVTHSVFGVTFGVGDVVVIYSAVGWRVVVNFTKNMTFYTENRDYLSIQNLAFIPFKGTMTLTQ